MTAEMACNHDRERRPYHWIGCRNSDDIGKNRTISVRIVRYTLVYLILWLLLINNILVWLLVHRLLSVHGGGLMRIVHLLLLRLLLVNHLLLLRLLLINHLLLYARLRHSYNRLLLWHQWLLVSVHLLFFYYYNFLIDVLT